jgi:chloramphenicol 3-O-phosphotransferase
LGEAIIRTNGSDTYEPDGRSDNELIAPLRRGGIFEFNLQLDRCGIEVVLELGDDGTHDAICTQSRPILSLHSK